MWTRTILHDLIDAKLKGFKFLVVANREPFIHQYKDGQIEVVNPASGMATALDPIMEASGGTWIAHGSGDADRESVDQFDRIQVPPHDPTYTLRRVWLTPEQEKGYYFGLSNNGLWPLCHVAFRPPTFRLRDWETYKEVNQLFADAVLEEAGDDPTFVFIQDFHFCLLPRMLKNANANLLLAHFWHIPWPNREVFRIFPWKVELLDGLLGNDLLGFHIRHHCLNFLDTVDRSIEAKVDLEKFEITRGDAATMIRPFPIGIDFDENTSIAQSSDVELAMSKWRKLIPESVEYVGIGIERLDYTKGIPQRLQALDELLDKNPDLLGRLLFIQVAVSSRSILPQYKRLAEEVEALAEEINQKWSKFGSKPILLLRQHQGPVDMMALHRISQFCVVSSLHDGMNLVAKEYVASRFDNDGVLILSQFTGSARELLDALLVNPFAIHELADAMLQAITMPDEERERRMLKLREEVQVNNVYRWAGKVLSMMHKFDFPENA